MTSISFKNVSVKFKLKANSSVGFRAKYKDFYALKDVSIDFNAGDKVGLLGENGAGKTTFLKVASMILPPDIGEVSSIGGVYTALSMRGNMLQEASCLENILMRGHYHGLHGSQLDEFVAGVIESAGLGRFAYQPVKTLSKGMRSRLIIAMFYIASSDILIFDEWIGVMDKTQFDDGATLTKIIEDAKIVLMASHKLGVIQKYCNKVLILDKGVIQYSGPAKRGIEIYKEALKPNSREGQNDFADDADD